MESLIIYPKNKKQFAALKGLFKAFDIPFEVGDSPYNPEFVKMIKQGEKDIKEGKGIRKELNDLFVQKVEKGLEDVKEGRVFDYKQMK